jgi:hypothetical protein
MVAWGSTVRLWLFGGRISPDGDRRIYCKIVIIRRDDLSGWLGEDLLKDCDYSVGRPLRIAGGGSTVRLWLWLFIERISPDGGRRIPDSHYLMGSPLRMVAGGSSVDCDYSLGWSLQIAAWGSTVKLWLFGEKISPDCCVMIYCKIVIIR